MRLRRLVCAAACVVMQAQALAADETKVPEKQPIGTVHMEADGTLTMTLRATRDDGTTGGSLLVLSPEHPVYQQTIDRVGGLKPGQSKTLYE